MDSLTAPCAHSASPNQDVAVADLEAAAMLCYSVLDQRLNIRDRYLGAARDQFISDAVREARMALDGASIEQILESRRD